MRSRASAGRSSSERSTSDIQFIFVAGTSNRGRTSSSRARVQATYQQPDPLAVEFLLFELEHRLVTGRCDAEHGEVQVARIPIAHLPCGRNGVGHGVDWHHDRPLETLGGVHGVESDRVFPVRRADLPRRAIRPSTRRSSPRRGRVGPARQTLDSVRDTGRRWPALALPGRRGVRRGSAVHEGRRLHRPQGCEGSLRWPSRLQRLQLPENVARQGMRNCLKVCPDTQPAGEHRARLPDGAPLRRCRAIPLR